MAKITRFVPFGPRVLGEEAFKKMKEAFPKHPQISDGRRLGPRITGYKDEHFEEILDAENTPKAVLGVGRLPLTALDAARKYEEKHAGRAAVLATIAKRKAALEDHTGRTREKEADLVKDTEAAERAAAAERLAKADRPAGPRDRSSVDASGVMGEDRGGDAANADEGRPGDVAEDAPAAVKKAAGEDGYIGIKELEDLLDKNPELLDRQITVEMNSEIPRKGALRLFLKHERAKEEPREALIAQLEEALEG